MNAPVHCHGSPVDFRFVGIDGRGRVSLVGDPREGRGLAVVRIEDQKGGREGYTFDLEWRGNSAGYGGGGGGYRPPVGGGNAFTAQQAINVCREAVADRARRDYGYRDVNFLQIGVDDNPGRRDWVMGTFEARRGAGGTIIFPVLLSSRRFQQTSSAVGGRGSKIEFSDPRLSVFISAARKSFLKVSDGRAVLFWFRRLVPAAGGCTSQPRGFNAHRPSLAGESAAALGTGFALASSV